MSVGPGSDSLSLRTVPLLAVLTETAVPASDVLNIIQYRENVSIFSEEIDIINKHISIFKRKSRWSNARAPSTPQTLAKNRILFHTFRIIFSIWWCEWIIERIDRTAELCKKNVCLLQSLKRMNFYSISLLLAGCFIFNGLYSKSPNCWNIEMFSFSWLVMIAAGHLWDI